jgi:hypothetical protein
VIFWTTNTTSPPATGVQGIMTITFNVIGSGSVSTVSSVTEAVSFFNDFDLLPRVVINEGSVILP